MILALRGAPATGKSYSCRKLALALPGWVFVSMREFLNAITSKDQAFDSAIECAKFYARAGRNIVFDSSLRRAEGVRKLSEIPTKTILFHLYHSNPETLERNWERRKNQTSFKQLGDTFTVEPQNYLDEIEIDASDPQYIDKILGFIR